MNKVLNAAKFLLSAAIIIPIWFLIGILVPFGRWHEDVMWILWFFGF